MPSRSAPSSKCSRWHRVRQWRTLSKWPRAIRISRPWTGRTPRMEYSAGCPPGTASPERRSPRDLPSLSADPKAARRARPKEARTGRPIPPHRSLQVRPHPTPKKPELKAALLLPRSRNERHRPRSLRPRKSARRLISAAVLDLRRGSVLRALLRPWACRAWPPCRRRSRR